MRCGLIDIPENLLDAIKNDRLVVFVGAGVSMGAPSLLPSFKKLTEDLASGTGHTPAENEPFDRFLGKLDHQGTALHERAAGLLTREDIQPTLLHRDILRLFSGPGTVRLVTTNFDLLFEQAAEQLWGTIPEVYRGPALPRGNGFDGLVHIHGSITRPKEMVLTDKDFGRAYLTEGWARQFLVDLFQTFSVLFIGYSHDDVVMDYLARALPTDGAHKRLALVPEDTSIEKWQLRGIDLVTYPMPSPNDHSLLQQGVGRLADNERRGPLEWRERIGQLAEQAPPPDQPSFQEDADLIKHCFNDEAKTRFFVEKARHPEWPSWLDRHKILDPLFSEGKLGRSAQLLAAWLPEHYAAQHADICLILIGKHHLNINPTFWGALSWRLARADITITTEDFNRWTSLLLETAPRYVDPHSLLTLIEKSTGLGCHTASLHLFAHAFKSHLMLREPFRMPEDQPESPKARVDLEIGDSNNHWALNEMWARAIQSNLDVLANDVISKLIPILEARHHTFHLWGRNADGWDTDSWHRSAIEPHEQDKYPECLDVMIDAVRDSLRWLAQEGDTRVSVWAQQLIKSPMPLVRRIGIYTWQINSSKSADEQVSMVLDHELLLDVHMHHEVYTLLRQSYAQCSQPVRERLIQAIQSYEWPRDDENKEVRTAYERYRWLHWLHESDTQCVLASEAVQIILSEQPDFKPREHPDLTHWSGEYLRGPTSPWNVEQLLQRTASEWLDELLDFKEEGFAGPDRYGFQQAITDAAKQNFQWGQDLAAALASRNEWASDIWDGILQAWRGSSGDKAEAEQILRWLERIELQTAHTRSIAEVLTSLLKEEATSYVAQLLDACDDVARALWPLIESEESPPPDDWLGSAINHTAGVVAQYWLKSIGLRAKQLPEGSKLPLTQQQNLTALLSEQSISGGYARTVLASQYAYFNYLNEEWANQHLLPLFTSTDDKLFHQAWDGFLTWGRLNRKIVELLKPAFFVALSRLEELSDKKSRFLELYTAGLFWYVDEPLTEWIPNFLQYANESERTRLANWLQSNIRGLKEEGQQKVWDSWLARYWQNRIQGIPAPLMNNEAAAMLEWLPHLADVFPQAVDIAVQMTKPRLNHGTLVFLLRKEENEIVATHPEAVARLLIYLLDCPEHGSVLHSLNDLTRNLDGNQIDPVILASLNGKLVAKGFNPIP